MNSTQRNHRNPIEIIQSNRWKNNGKKCAKEIHPGNTGSVSLGWAWHVVEANLAARSGLLGTRSPLLELILEAFWKKSHEKSIKIHGNMFGKSDIGTSMKNPSKSIGTCFGSWKSMKNRHRLGKWTWSIGFYGIFMDFPRCFSIKSQRNVKKLILDR